MKQFLTLIFSFLFAGSLFAKTITVSNNPNSPGQYNNLQTAIDAAVGDDSILVSGSASSYGNIAISKKIFLIGQGYAPVKDVIFNSLIDNIYFYATASGSLVSGFRLTFNSEPGTNGIVINRNTIAGGSTVRGSNWILSENYSANIYINGNDCIIKNNIIFGSVQSSPEYTNLLITNNDFTSGNSATSVFNAIINNNIFYDKIYANPGDFNYLGGTSNSVINNNITFSTTNINPLNIGVSNNTGTSNKYDTDPKYVSYFIGTYTIISTDNLQLKTSSPAKNAGTDGKDIGAHGGAKGLQYPYSGEPAIPQIKTMNIKNTTVAPGATLNVQLKANSNN